MGSSDWTSCDECGERVELAWFNYHRDKGECARIRTRQLEDEVEELKDKLARIQFAMHTGKTPEDIISDVYDVVHEGDE